MFGKTIEIGDKHLARVRIAQPAKGISRVVLETTGASDFSVSLKSNPFRLVVAIREAGQRERGDALARLAEKHCGRDATCPAPPASFPDCHHQPEGVRFQADRKIGGARGFQYYPADAFGRLRDTNSRQVLISDLNGLAEHARGQRGVVEVKINSFRIAQAVGFVLNFALHFNDDRTGVVVGVLR